MSKAMSTSDEYSIPQSTFRRLAKEIIGPDNNVSAKALDVLQQATEQRAQTMLRAVAVALRQEPAQAAAGVGRRTRT